MDYVKNANKSIISKKEVNKMPRGDRTGPMGSGPMTGRGMGYCAGYPGPGFMVPGPGLGFGRGFGMGRGMGGGMGRGMGGGMGRGMGYNPAFQTSGMPPSSPSMSQLSPEEELQYLKQQAEYLRQQTENISKRITELEKKK